MRSLARLRLVLAALVTVGATSGAAAGDRFFHHGFHHGHGGFHGRNAVAVGGLYGLGYDGTDIGYGGYGTPLVRFPRPNEIVPPAWGYGTYGVPTMPGIRQAPAGTPTVLVIDDTGPAFSRRTPGSRILARGSDGQWPGEPASESVPGGPHIVSVRVPRR